VIDHGDEEVEEEFTTILHLILHGAAALEGVPSSNNQSEIVRSKLGVTIRGVGVGKARRRQDGRALDA